MYYRKKSLFTDWHHTLEERHTCVLSWLRTTAAGLGFERGSAEVSWTGSLSSLLSLTQSSISRRCGSRPTAPSATSWVAQCSAKPSSATIFLALCQAGRNPSSLAAMPMLIRWDLVLAVDFNLYSNNDNGVTYVALWPIITTYYQRQTLSLLHTLPEFWMAGIDKLKIQLCKRIFKTRVSWFVIVVGPF